MIPEANPRSRGSIEAGSEAVEASSEAPPRGRDGILLIDKPAGITSHDVVAAVRRSLGGVRTGHAGTLDPFATGLLVVLVGKATKAQRQMMELRKRYETVARLGAVSSTGDTEGEITETGRLPADPPELPTGEIRQRPPIYSAVKVKGERAYKRARRGESFEMPERIVTVYRFEQLWRERATTGPPALAEGRGARSSASERAALAEERGAQSGASERAAFLIECSAGTYVRTLIADLNDAYCEELRRTRIGPFDVERAVPPPPRGRPWIDPPVIGLEQALAALE